jgi:hypothetical protein
MLKCNLYLLDYFQIYPNAKLIYEKGCYYNTHFNIILIVYEIYKHVKKGLTSPKVIPINSNWFIWNVFMNVCIFS